MMWGAHQYNRKTVRYYPNAPDEKTYLKDHNEFYPRNTNGDVMYWKLTPKEAFNYRLRVSRLRWRMYQSYKAQREAKARRHDRREKRQNVVSILVIVFLGGYLLLKSIL